MLPRIPRYGDFVRWEPATLAQAQAIRLWGRDVWRVRHVELSRDDPTQWVAVMLVPWPDGRERRGFMQWPRACQIIGFVEVCGIAATSEGQTPTPLFKTDRRMDEEEEEKKEGP